ncbi:MAG TPA: pseudouridine synthase [Luteibaculaceae bacterium]|nr:pseudouridine synthase [Luteibaculaceae bacterium]
MRSNDKPKKNNPNKSNSFRPRGEGSKPRTSRTGRPVEGSFKKDPPLPTFSEYVRLNKYIANAGVCSRREADELIKAGVVEVNGVIITEMGFKVGPGDKVKYGGDTLSQEKMRYVLLNKPKDFITTSSDPQNRRTVIHLVKNACKERIFSVGRLDRNTTGLLLFTNDGDLAKKLTHPRFNVKKMYHVGLDRPFMHADLQSLQEGITLEDGFIKPDAVDYVEGSDDKREVGIEIHSGKNRVVRRIFDALGYKVIKLDRVVFAGLTKKDLPRGKWRFLTEQEVAFLKMTK